MNGVNPIYSSTQRHVQTIRCCGRIYKRWRFVGERTFGRRDTTNKFTVNHRGPRNTHATVCAICGGLLTWNPNFEPQVIRALRREERQSGYYERRVNLHLLGLTTEGRPRRRSFMPVNRAELNRRQLQRWHDQAARFLRRGLTTRGTKRILLPRKKPTTLENAWRELRAAVPPALHIEDYVTSQWENYE